MKKNLLPKGLPVTYRMTVRDWNQATRKCERDGLTYAWSGDHRYIYINGFVADDNGFAISVVALDNPLVCLTKRESRNGRSTQHGVDVFRKLLRRGVYNFGDTGETTGGSPICPFK